MPFNNQTGRIVVILGPMFSGKSTGMMSRVRRYGFAQKSTVVIKYKKDMRYDETGASTHDKIKCEAVPASTMEEVDPLVSQYDVVGVDEGQFFPDLAPYCSKWADAGKVVIVAGLDSTYQRKPFGSMLELIPLAEEVTKLTAVCIKCGREASFTHRTSTETAVEVIGGSESYEPLCRSCFNRVCPPQQFASSTPAGAGGEEFVPIVSDTEGIEHNLPLLVQDTLRRFDHTIIRAATFERWNYLDNAVIAHDTSDLGDSFVDRRLASTFSVPRAPLTYEGQLARDVILADKALVIAASVRDVMLSDNADFMGAGHYDKVGVRLAMLVTACSSRTEPDRIDVSVSVLIVYMPHWARG